MPNEHDVASFRSAGFVVLRGVFDPEPLSHEMDRAFVDGLIADHTPRDGGGGVEFRYLPMMCERTPASLALIDTLAEVSSRLLGRSVLPGRAKGTRYVGDSGWHRDSELDIPSIGSVAYLEPLDARSGALQVVPGSHRGPAGRLPSASPDHAIAHVEVVATEPGDVIVFDEHLIHGSAGGGTRRQWRVDFVVDPTDRDEESLVRTSFARLFTGEFDEGYDPDRYPSYGPHWEAMDRPWTTRLRALGVYDEANAYEGRST